MQIERYIARGQVVAYPFGLANVAASQTDVQLVAADPSGNAGYVSPFAGEIVGIGWELSAAATAGTLTIGATVNGTEDADTTLSVPADASTTRGTLRVKRGKARFKAGDSIGAEITTNAGFLPITTDLTVTVYVMLELDGI